MAPASRFIPPERRDESVIMRPGPIGRARASLRALEALDRVTANGAAPSPGDLDDLRGWAGWGPMAPAFAPLRKGTWQEIGERLEWLLPPDQLREAEQATPNAFYTPPALAAGCWQILLDLGFTGGRVLEPGCGVGAFIAATPPGLDVSWTGVERDPVTARIAGLLHPSALILKERIQNAALPAHSMDAVLGNVPFGETPVYDPTAPRPVTKSLHNYCIWRSARALKPGGVAILITSRYTLDARDTYAREAIAAEADLLGAIRLPGDALSPSGPAGRRPAAHPVSLAHLDDADGTLFSLPEILATQHNGQAPRPQQTARPRSPRRTTPPPTTPDDADQPVLFDLPAPPAAEPRHPRTPQRRSTARRR